MKFYRLSQRRRFHLITLAIYLTLSPPLFAVFFCLTADPKTSPGTISNPYYLITADPAGISSIQIDPSGEGNFGTNITKGLFIKNITSTNSVTTVQGNNSIYFEDLAMSDGTNTFTADWQITLDGDTLKNRIICTTGHTHPATTVKLKYLLEIPWETDGYVTHLQDETFTRFITDAGQYLPIQMLKRKDSGKGISRLQACNEIYATGTQGYDLRFTGNMDMGLPGMEHFTVTENDSYLMDMKINKAGVLGRTMTWDLHMEVVPQTSRVDRLGVQIPTWGTTNSSVTLLLRKGGPGGDTIAEQRFQNIPGNAWRWLNVPDLPPGKYYLEMLDPDGKVGWFTSTSRPADAGAAYTSGSVVSDQTRWIKTVSTAGITNDIGSYTYPPKLLVTGQTYGQTFTLQEDVPDYYPELFTSGGYDENRLLNEFAYHGSFMSINIIVSELEEWMALKTAWTSSPLKDKIMANLLNDVHPIGTNGYVYTQGGLEGSLLLELYGPEGLDTRYFRNNPMYILAAHRLYTWTGDTNFLTNMMPKLRDVLNFIKVDQHGNNGLAVIDAVAHDGMNGSWGASSWYFETLPFGNKDALLNVYYYAALRAMAELELASARPVPAANLLSLSETVKTNFNAVFWSDDTKRYVGCVDTTGTAHDYGYTYINLQAVSYGLADTNQQASIFDWLENSDTSSGTNDVFSRWVISPRSSTLVNPFPGTGVTNDWWRAGVNGSYNWEEPTHNGGTCVQFLFYEMLARIQTYGASNAWTRFSAALNRYGEPDRLCGGAPLYRGEKETNLLPMNTPYAETGVAPSAFVHAFLGAKPDQSKLVIEPNVPEQRDYIGIRNLCYRGCLFDIKASHGQIEINCTDKPSGADVRVDMIPIPNGGDTYSANRVEIKVF